MRGYEGKYGEGRYKEKGDMGEVWEQEGYGGGKDMRKGGVWDGEIQMGEGKVIRTTNLSQRQNPSTVKKWQSSDFNIFFFH